MHRLFWRTKVMRRRLHPRRPPSLATVLTRSNTSHPCQLLHDSITDVLVDRLRQDPPLQRTKEIYIFDPHHPSLFNSFPFLSSLLLYLLLLGAVPNRFSPSNFQSHFSLHPPSFPSRCSVFPRSSCSPSLFPVHRLHPFTPSVSLKSSPIPPRSGRPLVYVDLKPDLR